MRILVLGSSGLIGHTLVRELSSCFDVFGTLHKLKHQYNNSLFSSDKFIDNIDVLNFEYLKKLIIEVKPDVIFNCVGITKRKINIDNISEVIFVNSCFPHNLARFTNELNIRVIHFSTDCVFDGKVGNYTESSLTTAEDLYGRTKALGEITYNNTLTIRSSFIGQELFDKTELLDWFLSQDGKSIKGYRNTYYSGVSTIFLAKLMKEIILFRKDLNGLYQLSPEKPISKYDLLSIAKNSYKVNVDIIPDDSHIHNPTLNSEKLRNAIDLKVPSWIDMMDELVKHRYEYTLI